MRRLRTDLRHVRANATLRAAPGRHALRLAAVVAGTELLTRLVALPRGYWAVVAAAMVLRPGFGATFTRGAERMIGTCLGVVLASLIAVAIDPNGWGLVAVVGLLAYCTYALFPASFTAGTAVMTAVVVFLLHAVVGDSLQTALDRGLDTAIGGAIGLVAYALWPTWSARSIDPLLAKLVDAQRDYMAAVLDALTTGAAPDVAAIRARARRARIAFTDCEAVITLARAEPLHGRDPTLAQTTLSALRRVVYAIHTLRVDPAVLQIEHAHRELRPLCDALGSALGTISTALTGNSADDAQLTPLRHIFRLTEWTSGDRAWQPALDELVDAIDAAAASIGVRLP